MEQRDLLKDQIEQLGKVLAKILFDFLSLKSKGQAAEGIEITNKRLQSEVDIDIEKLVMLSKEELKDNLIKTRFTGEHSEILSEYITALGKVEIEINTVKANMWFEKAIELLDIADEVSNTISLERMHKRNEIERLLQQFE